MCKFLMSASILSYLFIVPILAIGENIEPVINVSKYISLGSKQIIDADDSTLLPHEKYGKPTFMWKFSDNIRSVFGAHIDHRFLKKGKNEVHLTIQQGDRKEMTEKMVWVYDKEAVFVVGNEFSHYNFDDIAGTKGIKANTISISQGSFSGSITSDAITSKLFLENYDALLRSEFLIFTTNPETELRSFAQFWNKIDKKSELDLSNKVIVQITKYSLDKAESLAHSVFDILSVPIIITRPTAIEAILELPHSSSSEVVELLDQRVIEYKLIDSKFKKSFIFVFSNLSHALLAKGVSSQSLYMLLSIPFLIFLIVFFRQFVGISTFGVFSPLILAMSGFVLGFYFSFIAIIVVILVSALIRKAFDYVDLLYIPKLGLLLSALGLSFLMLFSISIFLGFYIDLSLVIFPSMMMSTLSEKFLSTQSSEGFCSALFSTVETIVVAFLSYLICNIDFIKQFILSIPELILLPLLGIIWLGKFTGLRITEYFRFKELMHESQEE